MKKKSPIEFKGTVNGLYLAIDDSNSFEEILESLEKLLEQSSEFYKGSSIIGSKGKPLTYTEKAELERKITSFGISVSSLEIADEVKKKPVVQEKIEPQIIEKEIIVEREIIKSDTQFVYGTMRSGRSVNFKGNVVVLGDVNPGAEIVAGGNVIVIGKLLGFVHAGAYGDAQAIVVANALAPTQIRISSFISVPPQDDKREHVIKAEKAFVSDGIIKLETIH